ncbi:unnamed protein product, partial [Linum tenue]
ILSSLHSPSQTSLCFVSHICSLEISGERSNGEGKSERTSEESKEPQIRKIRWRGHTEGRRDRSIDGKLIVNPDGLSLDARKIDFLEEINDISTTFPAHMRSDSRNQRNSERVNACVVWSRKDHESQICWRLLSADSSSLYPVDLFSLSLPHFKFVSSLLNNISSTSLLL